MGGSGSENEECYVRKLLVMWQKKFLCITRSLGMSVDHKVLNEHIKSYLKALSSIEVFGYDIPATHIPTRFD